jgi:hypothetical protein
MPLSLAAAKLEPVSLTIHITLTVDGEAIEGVASAGSAAPIPFYGWLGLMSTVDALVGSGTGALASPPGDGGGERTRTQH